MFSKVSSNFMQKFVRSMATKGPGPIGLRTPAAKEQQNLSGLFNWSGGAFTNSKILPDDVITAKKTMKPINEVHMGVATSTNFSFDKAVLNIDASASILGIFGLGASFKYHDEKQSSNYNGVLHFSLYVRDRVESIDLNDCEKDIVTDTLNSISQGTSHVISQIEYGGYLKVSYSFDNKQSAHQRDIQSKVGGFLAIFSAGGNVGSNTKEYLTQNSVVFHIDGDFTSLQTMYGPGDYQKLVDDIKQIKTNKSNAVVNPVVFYMQPLLPLVKQLDLGKEVQDKCDYQSMPLTLSNDLLDTYKDCSNSTADLQQLYKYLQDKRSANAPYVSKLVTNFNSKKQDMRFDSHKAFNRYINYEIDDNKFEDTLYKYRYTTPESAQSQAEQYIPADYQFMKIQK